jgi:Spy/CpxP family protein refolding chaperone
MKTKRVLVLTMLFSTLCVVMALAQGPRGNAGTPEERAAKTTEHMKKALNLTDEQAAKVQTLNLNFFKEQQKAREAVKDANQDLREGMKAKLDARDAELQKILTPDQFKQYQADKQKRMQNHPTPPTGNGAGN